MMAKLQSPKNYLAHKYESSIDNYMYDSDSYLIGLDDHASYCISPQLKNFIPETLQKYSVKVKGVRGGICATQTGTLQWRVADDMGRNHILCIPNSKYIIHLPTF